MAGPPSSGTFQVHTVVQTGRITLCRDLFLELSGTQNCRLRDSFLPLRAVGVAALPCDFVALLRTGTLSRVRCSLAVSSKVFIVPTQFSHTSLLTVSQRGLILALRAGTSHTGMCVSPLDSTTGISVSPLLLPWSGASRDQIKSEL